MSLKYTEEHEWILVEGDIATVGITHHAQDALGDVVFVELPEVGSSFEQKAVAGGGVCEGCCRCVHARERPNYRSQ